MAYNLTIRKGLGMNMEIVGPGVWLMDGWGNVRPRPREVIAAIPGSLGDNFKEGAAVMVVSFSDAHNAWCGVEWVSLSAKILGLKPDCYYDLKKAIEEMILDGLLEIPRPYKRWYSGWLNRFEPKVVCPTRRLLNTVVTEHLSQLCD